MSFRLKQAHVHGKSKLVMGKRSVALEKQKLILLDWKSTFRLVKFDCIGEVLMDRKSSCQDEKSILVLHRESTVVAPSAFPSGPKCGRRRGARARYGLTEDSPDH